MPAFRPEPTDSPSRLANRLFLRLVALWIALQLLFETLDVFLESRADEIE